MAGLVTQKLVFTSY